MDEDLSAGGVVRDIGNLNEILCVEHTDLEPLAFDNDDLPKEKCRRI